VLPEEADVLDPFEAIEPYINPLDKSKPAVTAMAMPNASAVEILFSRFGHLNMEIKFIATL